MMQFWFEFGSNYSYPAAMRIEALAAERSVNLAWRPFLLGPIFADQGWHDSPFNLYPAKGRYMWRDMERICARHGLPWRRPSSFPRSGLLAARVTCRFADEPWVPAFVRAVFHANFAEDREIGEAAVVDAILGSLDLPTTAILDEARSEDGKRRLRDQTDAARRLGLFGAPSFVVDDELFWGHDRMVEAMDWATAGARPAEGAGPA